MARMIEKLFIALLLMLIPPIGILYCFSQDMLPGSTNLLSGLLAFIAVNMVIVFYVCMAMDKPEDKHEPDSTKTSAVENSSLSRDKQE